MPVDVLFDLADGLTLDEILRAYPTLDREHAVRALEVGILMLPTNRCIRLSGWCRRSPGR